MIICHLLAVNHNIWHLWCLVTRYQCTFSVNTNHFPQFPLPIVLAKQSLTTESIYLCTWKHDFSYVFLSHVVERFILKHLATINTLLSHSSTLLILPFWSVRGVKATLDVIRVEWAMYIHDRKLRSKILSLATFAWYWSHCSVFLKALLNSRMPIWSNSL